jgi:uncharacterized protein (DUF2141 family)
MSELGPIFWLSLLLSLPEGPPAPEDDALVTLEVEATGFDSDHGHAIGALFRPGANVRDPNAAFSRVSGEIRGGEASLRFPPAAEGRYALVVFHDANDNGRVDHGPLGLPTEQLGFSNGFRPGLLSGLPTFDKLQFELKRAPGPGRCGSR